GGLLQRSRRLREGHHVRGGRRQLHVRARAGGQEGVVHMKRLLVAVVFTACPTLPGMPMPDAGTRQPGPPAVDVVAGATHACARMPDGTVRCWGCYCSSPTLPMVTSDGYPVKIAGITNPKQLALGRDFTCALLQDQTVSCWGLGTSGQLGEGNATDSMTP